MTVLCMTETYSIIHCAKCGIGFGITDDFENKRRTDRKSFYCPSGHSQWIPGKTDEQRVRELRAQVASKNDLLESMRRENEKRYRLQRAAEGKTRGARCVPLLYADLPESRPAHEDAAP